ncbi:MAG: carbamoyl-phosphate synthase small subunit [Bdellovibrio sp. CG10_big_fil_rev_8_21_14_0_10_47_8]|nr:MAG: carbamoyl-phosphate synthase small subunit [Bdellovibrio sp. CG10_big_fil_rev_8_21_14_0_10_47_8]
MSAGYLVLETGEIFEGLWRSSSQLGRAGEVVFNTSHSGYEEIATDPSYFSQIVVMTASMQGNYGVDRKCWESRRLWIEGFVCLQLQESPRDSSWIRLLNEFSVPCLSDVDTRAIALRLREGGTPWGALVSASSKADAIKKAQELIQEKKKLAKDWVFEASRKETETRKGSDPKGPRVAVLDFGSKENILRELSHRCSELAIFSSRASVQEIEKYKPDGVMLTNGPGDPTDVQVATETVRSLLGRIPVYGICMGHQILGLALGAQTYKLKFGHRGANHPIRDDLLKKIYMTSQNHGYAVDKETLPKDVRVSHVNLNDMTVAGIYSETRNCLGIQYHPESHPGPHEAVQLFDFFIDRMIRRKQL